MEVRAERLDDSLFRIHVQVLNLTAMADTLPVSRDEAMMFSLVSSHLVLTVDGGDLYLCWIRRRNIEDAAAQCQNVGSILCSWAKQADRIRSFPRR